MSLRGSFSARGAYPLVIAALQAFACSTTPTSAVAPDGGRVDDAGVPADDAGNDDAKSADDAPAPSDDGGDAQHPPNDSGPTDSGLDAAAGDAGWRSGLPVGPVDMVAAGAIDGANFACQVTVAGAVLSTGGTYRLELKGTNPGALTLDVTIVPAVSGISVGDIAQTGSVDASGHVSAVSSDDISSMTLSAAIDFPRVQMTDMGTVTSEGITAPLTCTGNVPLAP
jgi:hypothetical protein